jgi:FKBP-type peptidyl-prolyl cis-trans isomerase FkpA
MKQNIVTLLLISVIGLVSCRKDNIELSIKQYDQQQIENYIAANGLTGMKRDTTGGDTSGIYYQIIIPGSGTPVDYPDLMTFAYTVRTFDGKYVSTDSIANHFYDYVGHINKDKFPLGLQTAVHNLLKYPNASMRVLIPSHLAYGRNGSGSGSSQVANNRINGNQCMDYYIHAVNNFPVYDDVVIKSYMAANSLTGYTKTADGLYYKILIQGTSNDVIVPASSITCTYTGQMLDGNVFDGSHNGTNVLGATEVDSFIPGVTEGLQKAVVGTQISLLIPSSLAYGITGGNGIPAFSCLRFTFQIVTVTP